MAKTHWKRLTNPDYLGAYALEDGKDMIVTIKNVSVQSITGQNGQKEDEYHRSERTKRGCGRM